MLDMEIPLNLSHVNIDELFKNLSAGLPQSEQDRLHPTSFQVATKAAFYALSFIVAVVGNVVILVTVASTPGLRTRFNLYMVNIAVSDLLVALCCMWPHFVASNSVSWVLGAFMCRFYTFIEVTSVSSMILTLMTTVLDRFSSAVYRPMLIVTQRCQPAVLGVIWACSCLVSLPWPLYLKQIDTPFLGSTQTMCLVFFPSVTSKKVYVTVFITLLFLLPVTLLFFLFLVTAQRMWTNQEPGAPRALDVTMDMTSSPRDARRQAVWMTGTLLLVMTLFWSPQMGLLLWEAHRDNSPPPKGLSTFHYMALYLAYTSSAIHPLVYIGFNKHLRHEAWRRVSCRPVGLESVITVTPAVVHVDPGSSTRQTPTVQSTDDTDGRLTAMRQSTVSVSAHSSTTVKSSGDAGGRSSSIPSTENVRGQTNTPSGRSTAIELVETDSGQMCRFTTTLQLSDDTRGSPCLLRNAFRESQNRSQQKAMLQSSQSGQTPSVSAHFATIVASPRFTKVGSLHNTGQTAGTESPGARNTSQRILAPQPSQNSSGQTLPSKNVSFEHIRKQTNKLTEDHTATVVRQH